MKKAVVSEEILRLAIRKKLEQDLINEAGILPKAPGAVQKPGKPGDAPAVPGASANLPSADMKMAGIGLPFSQGLSEGTFNAIDPNVKALVDMISSDAQWMDTFGQITGYDLDQSVNVGLGLGGTYSDAAQGPVPNIVLKKIAQLLLAGEKAEFVRKNKTALTISPKLTTPSYILLRAEDGTGSVLYASQTVNPVDLSKLQTFYDPKANGSLAEKAYVDLFARKDASEQLKILINPQKGLKQSNEFGGTLRFVYIAGDNRPAENMFEKLTGLQTSAYAQTVIAEVQKDQFEELFLTALERMSWAKIPGENPYSQLYKAYQEFHRIVSRDKKVGALAITSQWSLYAGSLAAVASYEPGKLTQLRENRRIRRLNRRKKVRLTEAQIRSIIRNAIQLLSEAKPVVAQAADAAGEGGTFAQLARASRERDAGIAAMAAEARRGLNISPETGEAIKATMKAAIGDAKISAALAQSIGSLEKNILEASRSAIPDLIVSDAALRKEVVDFILPQFANKADREVLDCLLQLHTGLGEGSARAATSMEAQKANVLQRLEALKEGQFKDGGTFITNATDVTPSEQIAAFKRISSEFNLNNFSPDAVARGLVTNSKVLEAVNKALGDIKNPESAFNRFFRNNATLSDVGIISFDTSTNRWVATIDPSYQTRLAVAQSAVASANALPIRVPGATTGVTEAEKQAAVASAKAELEDLMQTPVLLRKIAGELNTNVLAQETLAGSVTTLVRRASIDADLMQSYDPTHLAKLMDKGIMNPKSGLMRGFEELMTLKGTGEFSEELRVVYPILNRPAVRIATVALVGGPTGWLNKIVTRKYIGEPVEKGGKILKFFGESVSNPIASTFLKTLGTLMETTGRTGTFTMLIWSTIVMMYGPTIVQGAFNEDETSFWKLVVESAANDVPGRPDISAFTSAIIQVIARSTAVVQDDDIAAMMFYANALDNMLAFDEYLMSKADRKIPFFSDAAIYFTVKGQSDALQQLTARLTQFQNQIGDNLGNSVKLAQMSEEIENIKAEAASMAESGNAAAYFETLEDAAHDIFDEMLTCIRSIRRQTDEIYIPKPPTTFGVLNASRGVLTITPGKEEEAGMPGWSIKLLQKVHLIDENYQDDFIAGLAGLVENENNLGGESWSPGGIASRAEATIKFLQSQETTPLEPEAPRGTAPEEP